MNIYVYWIHYPHHIDPRTEGYIGVSKYPSRRLAYHSHSNQNDNLYLYRSINKGAIQSILYECSAKEYAYMLEKNLRPIDGIGWNIQSGGTQPPSQLGRKNPNVSNSNRSRTVSQATRLKMSEQRKKWKWYTNGTSNTRGTVCPDGWYPGKTCPKGWHGSKKA